MLFKDSIDVFLKYISSYCSQDTYYYYSINLNMFSDYLYSIKSDSFTVGELTKADFIGYISYLRTKTVKNTSVRTYARAVRVYLRYLYSELYIFEDITLNVKFPRVDSRPISPLSDVDVDLVINSLSGKCKERNTLIFRLMLDCGLRLQEIVHLNISDINIKDNYIRIINTKYNKCRFVPLPDKVKCAYLNYIPCIMSFISDFNVPLFYDIHYNARLSKTAIKKLFNRLKFKHNIELYPHLLRHTFATSFIMGGGNLEVLRLLLGHNDYNVTRNYIHLANQFSLLKYDIYKLDKCMFNSYQVYNAT